MIKAHLITGKGEAAAHPRRVRPALAATSLLGAALGFIYGCTTVDAVVPEAGTCDESPGKLFARRIEPLLSAEHPETCGQCHVGGVRLASFLRDTACESMACLQAEGLVNLEDPETSVLLSWIERAEPESQLITADVILEERAAFLEWIEHEAECGSCQNVACSEVTSTQCETGDDLLSPFEAETDPGDCGRETMDRLFRGTVYKHRSRCSPCHFTEENSATADAPHLFQRTGDCRVASLGSMERILSGPYIDLQKPEDSLLILKPLAEVEGGVPHGGHDKFVKSGDDAYDAFLYFVTRYAECSR